MEHNINTRSFQGLSKLKKMLYLATLVVLSFCTCFKERQLIWEVHQRCVTELKFHDVEYTNFWCYTGQRYLEEAEVNAMFNPSLFYLIDERDPVSLCTEVVESIDLRSLSHCLTFYLNINNVLDNIQQGRDERYQYGWSSILLYLGTIYHICHNQQLQNEHGQSLKKQLRYCSLLINIKQMVSA